MNYWEDLIWFFIPIVINTTLAFATRRSFPITRKNYFHVWLVLVGVIGVSVGPRCMCIDYFESIAGAIIGSLVYSIIAFIVYILARFMNKLVQLL